jgi:hypothetical protein
MGTKQIARNVVGQMGGGGGHKHYFVFSQKEVVLLKLQRFNENHWRPSTAFLMKTLDNVTSNGKGTQIAASSHRGSSLKRTKVSNLYDYFKQSFLTFLGIFGSPLMHLKM